MFLIIDATMGQNGVFQASSFAEATGLAATATSPEWMARPRSTACLALRPIGIPSITSGLGKSSMTCRSLTSSNIYMAYVSRERMMKFLGLLILFIVIDLAITTVLGLLGTPSFIINVIVSFVMAFIFSVLRHDKTRGPFYKDIGFHRNFAMVFILLLLAVTYVIGLLL
ncbi:MAG: hypothetical protein MZV49_05330 [Rhodopseudomonas palustris]|nr:hypothetical protein [Rhodopseudomonas palustris]